MSDWLDGLETLQWLASSFPAEEAIRKLRKEGRITILEHSEEEEKQSNHSASASYEFREGVM